MIKVDISRCTGCRRCETTCAFVHTGRVSNRLARIKVLNIYETGIDGPVVCAQCQERTCLQSCPEQAISIGAEGQVYVSPTVCKLCGVCQKSCPIGAIEIFDDLVFVCDLCGGEPRCVSACTEAALSYQPGSAESVTLKPYMDESKRLSPGEKRLHFLQSQAIEVRSAWGVRHG